MNTVNTPPPGRWGRMPDGMMGCSFDVFPLAFHSWVSLVAWHAGVFASAVVAILMGLGVLALPWWTPLAVFAVGVGVALPFEAPARKS